MKNHPLILLLSVLVLLGTGCTHTAKLAIRPTALPAREKLPVRAALVLDSELDAYKYEFRLMGDLWVFPFGPALKEQARNVTIATFREVNVVATPEQAAAQKPDIILHLRGGKAEQSVPVMAWQEINFVMTTQWTGSDRTSKNTIWLKPITAKAAHAAGNVFTGSANQAKLMQKLFDDFSLQSYEAFFAATELRQVATHAAPASLAAVRTPTPPNPQPPLIAANASTGPNVTSGKSPQPTN